MKIYLGFSLRIRLMGVSPVPITVSGPSVNLPSVMLAFGLFDRTKCER